MRYAALVTVLAASIAFAAGGVLLDHPLYVPGADAEYELTYDDGSAYWLSWSGLYRGVWFHLDDFGMSGWVATHSEFWFYHHSNYPWDTSSFYGLLYDGGSSGPGMMFDETSVTALHYAPCMVTLTPSVYFNDDFWVLVNSEMSAGGWPSILEDYSAGATDHSFQSDDFSAWAPSPHGDYFIRSVWYNGLDSETWGAIKTLF